MVSKRSTQRPRSVRIIAGQWRGRRLGVALEEGLRPTPDRARETLFNWLAPIIAGARCLDLFAGTGALGFEALSRGAAHTVFVEDNVRLVAALRQAAGALAADCTVLESRACEFLNQTEERFDVVFLDPPYRADLQDICTTVVERRLQPRGLVYVERSSAADLHALESTGRLIKQSRVGGVYFGLLEPSVEA